jgi:hypothetical protein
MPKRRETKASRAVDRLMKQPADLRKMGKPGDVLHLADKAAHQLSIELARHEDPDYVSVSWAHQETAQNFYNEFGLARTLDWMFGLRASSDERDAPRIMAAFEECIRSAASIQVDDEMTLEETKIQFRGMVEEKGIEVTADTIERIVDKILRVELSPQKIRSWLGAL